MTTTVLFRETEMRATRLAIFTDLDGTLIDFETYSTKVAKPTIDRLMEANVPIVFCSSKTFAEQRALQKRFEIEMPCIVENGSAIFCPTGFIPDLAEALEAPDGWYCIQLGMSADAVKQALRGVERTIGEPLLGFSDLSTEDVARATGLDIVSAKRAQRRDFSETITTRRDPEFWLKLDPVFEQHGLLCLHGGRFHTVVGKNASKGEAIKRYRALLDRGDGVGSRAIGFGDSANDASLLDAVDCGYQVKRPDGSWARDLSGPKVKRVDGIGPIGWVMAVEKELDRASVKSGETAAS